MKYQLTETQLEAVISVIEAERNMLKSFGYKPDTSRGIAAYWIDNEGGSVSQANLANSVREQCRSASITMRRLGV